MNKKSRQSGIELLRIVAICGVVLLHYNGKYGFAAVAHGSINEIILNATENLFICAVNVFILISGYFNCTTQNRRVIKIVELLLQVIVFRLIWQLYAVFCGAEWKTVLLAFLPVNYFFILYATLYLISPYINIVLKRLSKERLQFMILSLFLLFSLYPTIVSLLELKVGPLRGLSTISLDGSGAGYTIVNFVVVYCIGSYLHLLDVRIKRGLAALGYFICAAVLFVWSRYELNIAWSYCNPFVIAEAVFLFLLFREVNFANKYVNSIASAVFTCYLFHDFILEWFNIVEAVQGETLYMIGHMLFTCSVSCVVSWLLFHAWNYMIRPIKKWLGNLCDKLDLDSKFSPEQE